MSSIKVPRHTTEEAGTDLRTVRCHILSYHNVDRPSECQISQSFYSSHLAIRKRDIYTEKVNTNLGITLKF